MYQAFSPRGRPGNEARHSPVVRETARVVYRSSPAFPRVYFHGHPVAKCVLCVTRSRLEGGGGGGMGPAFHPPGSAPAVFAAFLIVCCLCCVCSCIFHN